MPNSNKTETVIEKFRSVHGGKYDYSKVDYINNITKVCIICPEHGEFWQTPKNHLKGCGCQKCSGTYHYTTEEWIARAKAVHGDRYDYSKTVFVKNNEKVCIICPEHGEFWQIANNHIKGEGCIKCRNDKMASERMLGNDKFIEKAKKTHGDKYDYSKVDYKNSQTKVCITCPVHGDFWQQPHNHINGQGCPMCFKNRPKKEKPVKPQADKTKVFIGKAVSVHGNQYDYAKVAYNNSHTKVCIICPEHGEFWQTPNKHLIGRGCPECVNKRLSEQKRFTKELFVEKANNVHGNKYDYSKVEYTSSQDKVCIICPEHGEFIQAANSHLQGCGCPVCAQKVRTKKQTGTTESFIEKATELYGDRYDYTKVKYVSNTTPVTIVCHQKYANGSEHGEFKVSPNKFLGRGTECPRCSAATSKPEIELYDYICGLVGKSNVIRGDRKTLDGYEIDIYVPSMQIGFEFNGLFWHSDAINHNTPKTHLEKTLKCEEKGITLIQIFSDEYFRHKDIVKEKIRHLLDCDKDKPKAMARKCSVKEIDWETAKSFLETYHIQGKSNATVFLGCFHEGTLVAVMTFLRQSEGKYELVRFATNHNFRCQGVGGKMFRYFTENYNPGEVKSFADRRWTNELKPNLYILLGFEKTKVIPPDYRYILKSKPSERIHKFNFRKQVLHKKYGFPMTMTEREMTESLGYNRVYDCGLIKYVWRKGKQ